MRIYYADIREADEDRALYPPMSQSRGSAFGMSLLAAAYEDYKGAKLPLIARLFSGKPYFKNEPKLHYSISHSRTHVLCALSNKPVGADTLDHRPLRPATIERLATQEELSFFSFHELWALRESFFKLTGQGSLRSMRFTMDERGIKTPSPEVFSRLYTDIEDSSTAISAYEDDFPKRLIKVPIEKLIKNDGLINRL